MNERSPVRLLKELKRRRVFRVAAVYAVVAWVVIEVASVILPALTLPAWSVTLVTVLAILGFPIAVVLAWAFEMTPEGIEPVTGADSASGGARAAYVGIGILVALVGFGTYGWLGTRDVDPGAADAADIRSIAVLPFADLSREQDQEYFADGIAEELLNALAKVPELQVAARTSSFAFKGRNQDVREIADALGVRAVLEGSVRKQNDRIRINAQLVDAATGYDLWSHRYDREAHDIFAIQDEIARAIVDALRIELLRTGEEGDRLVRRATESVEAHDLYLLGRHYWHRRGPALDTALTYFRRAVEIDPGYAPAHAGLASTYAVAGYYLGMPMDEIAERGRAAALEALALDPELAEAHGALGHLAMNEADWAAAERHFRRALELNPEYASAYQWLGELFLRLGRFDDANDALERARRLDPLSGVLHWQFVHLYGLTGRSDSAIAAADRTLEYSPALTMVDYYLALWLLRAGRVEEALVRFGRLARSPKERAAFEAIVETHVDRRPRGDDCVDAVRAIESGQWGPPLLNGDEVAFLYAMCGAGDPAIDGIRRAYRRGMISVALAMVMYREYDAIARHPGYADLARDMNLEWLLESARPSPSSG